MVFKFFGFKANLHGRRKTQKADKDEIICIGYRVNPDLHDSLPPPTLRNTQEIGHSSKDFSQVNKDSNGSIPHSAIKNSPGQSSPPTVSNTQEIGHSSKAPPTLRNTQEIGHSSKDFSQVNKETNGGIPHSAAIKNSPGPPSKDNQQKNATNGKGKDVVRERKTLAKPAAKDLFNKAAEESSSSRHDENKQDLVTLESNITQTSNSVIRAETPKSAVASEADSSTKISDQSATVSPKSDSIGDESESDRKSTLIFLTENHDEDDRYAPRPDRNSDIYEEVGFNSKPDPTLNITQSRQSECDDDNSGYSNQQMYSSQAASLFFSEPEPEPQAETTKTNTKRKGRAPQPRHSETSA